MHTTQYIAMVPDVVWAALLGSALTLLGVWLSNRRSTKNLLKTLEHESNEKAKDRIHSLRKEIYLLAAEEMAKVANHLGKIPQLDPAKENIADGLSGFFGASMRLQLVAESETAKLANELTARYSEILFALLPLASPVHTLQGQIQIENDLCAQRQAELNRVLAEMTRINESGHPEPQRFDALQRSFDYSQQALTRIAEDRSEKFEKKNGAMRKYTIELLKHMRSVGPLQMRLGASMRTELALVTEPSDYEAQAQANFDRIDRSVKQLLEKLEEEG